MKLKDTMKLYAGNLDTLPYVIPENGNPLLTTHINQVSEEVKNIKNAEEKIFMTSDYKKYKDGYRSIIYSGVAGPAKQTVVITDKDGNKKVLVSKLG